MIKINRKEECVGCQACVQICPKKCISFNHIISGFIYPHVDSTICINCDLCEKVCPTHNIPEKREEQMKVFAMKNKSDIEVKSSSSGGLFIEIGRYIIQKGGIVYGVTYANDFKSAIYKRATQEQELELFKGSKYVQADLDNVYINIKKDLKSGALVLFSGTPCCVMALKNFLHKDYKNLFLVDLVCHGVPSPILYNKYIRFAEERIGCHISNLTMRDKKYGWRHRLFLSIKTDSQKYIIDKAITNVYMEGFSQNLTLRPSCFECKYSNLNRPGDITIADYWGIEKIYKKFRNTYGVSLYMSNNIKGDYIFENIKNKFTFIQTTVENCIQHNLQYPTKKPYHYDTFWRDWENLNEDFKSIARKYLKYKKKERILYQIKKLIKILLRKDF